MRTFRSRMHEQRPGGENAQDALRPSPDNAGQLGWTKQELMDSSGLSGKTFDTLRKAARVKGPSHGGLTYVFGVEDVIALTRKAGSGSFSERGGPAAKAWKALLKEAGVFVDDLK